MPLNAGNRLLAEFILFGRLAGRKRPGRVLLGHWPSWNATLVLISSVGYCTLNFSRSEEASFTEAEGQCTNLRCHFDISNGVTLRQSAGFFEGAWRRVVQDNPKYGKTQRGARRIIASAARSRRWEQAVLPDQAGHPSRSSRSCYSLSAHNRV